MVEIVNGTGATDEDGDKIHTTKCAKDVPVSNCVLPHVDNLDSEEESGARVLTRSRSRARIRDSRKEKVDEARGCDFGIVQMDNIDYDVNADNLSMSCDVKPKAKMYVEYMLGNGKTSKAKVLSQQPKKGSRYGHWVNVHVDEETVPSCVNWKDVTEWRQIKEYEHSIFLTATEQMDQEVVDAKEQEVQNLLANDVYELVKDMNQPRVTTKWIFTKKVKEGQEVVKARLVARGFEEPMQDNRTDSPTCSRQSLRLCFVTAPSMGWKIHSLDITSAFLQGNAIERDVYLEPPAEFYEHGMLWKLKRCIYGLNDAPRAWYEVWRKKWSNLVVNLVFMMMLCSCGMMMMMN